LTLETAQPKAKLGVVTGVAVRSIIVGVALLALGGCATVVHYPPPQPGQPTASVRFQKGPDFDQLTEIAVFSVFDDPRCALTEGDGQIAAIYYTTPQPVQIAADEPIFLQAVTTRHQGVSNIGCVNVVSFAPRAGEVYTVRHLVSGARCDLSIEYADQPGADVEEAAPVRTPDSCVPFAASDGWKRIGGASQSPNSAPGA
jgi:hypothetical protein